MAYRHLMVPFDGSPLARSAMSLAAWIAWRSDAELDLVQAVQGSPHIFRRGLTPNLDALDVVDELAKAKSELSQEAQRLRDEGLRATGVAFPGDPRAVLLSYADRFKLDLIIMGTHGRSLPQRWLVGSVASSVARSSHIPVILVPREASIRRDDELRILVALDGSTVCETALEAALKLADGVPARITLFHVIQDGGADVERHTAEWYQRPVLGQTYLEDIQRRLAARGVSAARAYASGQPGDEIVEFAQLGSFDLVAVATRSRSGIERLVLGSVAEQMVRQVHVPVLISQVGTARSLDPGKMAGAAPGSV